MQLLASDHFEADMADWRCRIARERFKQLRAEARTFDAAEALDLKLLTQIVDDEDVKQLFPQPASDDADDAPPPLEPPDRDRTMMNLARAFRNLSHSNSPMIVGLPSDYIQAVRKLARSPMWEKEL